MPKHTQVITIEITPERFQKRINGVKVIVFKQAKKEDDKTK